MEIFNISVISSIFPTFVGWLGTSFLGIVCACTFPFVPAVIIFFKDGWKEMKKHWRNALKITVVTVLIVYVPIIIFAWGYVYKNFENLKIESTEQVSNMPIANSIRIAVYNDLKYTIPVTNGIQGRIKEKKFNEKDDPEKFMALYSPTVVLPSVDSISSLNPEVLTWVDEYRRRLAFCAINRLYYYAELKSNKTTNIETPLEFYGIILDSVIRTGFILLDTLDKYYPNGKNTRSDLPEYQIIDPLVLKK